MKLIEIDVDPDRNLIILKQGRNSVEIEAEQAKYLVEKLVPDILNAFEVRNGSTK